MKSWKPAWSLAWPKPRLPNEWGPPNRQLRVLSPQHQSIRPLLPRSNVTRRLWGIGSKSALWSSNAQPGVPGDAPQKQRRAP